MAEFPTKGQSPYGPPLKAYIDEGDAVVAPHNHDAVYFTEVESDARYPKAPAIRDIVVLTQAAYTALAVKVATTLYVIVG